MQTQILIIPGLGGSGETHWQSLWHQKYPKAQSVIQDDWENPLIENWIPRLEEVISQLTAPTILVAHSLGAISAVHWANKYTNSHIVGALLVAPADVDSDLHAPEIIRNFAPIPLAQLHFPSILITSSNDPYISVERASFLAGKWGSELVNIGEKGHINTESNLGLWEEGQEYLNKLMSR
ncbi:alpha/beta hydrolase [Flavobacterium sp. NG2]|uniref:RBBP9/YdeN family alpha/beta hydrolase n=1 Tax=Flavobacterium sp. NG2 TaxID=3097547 RepID=UPI002A7F8FF5|nr:alpha/beta hydrolase [Flavobacterium sp. NG2]WPR70068.1 alpha/beta hydrolase [Flavobacterium sp. NG2]